MTGSVSCLRRGATCIRAGAADLFPAVLRYISDTLRWPRGSVHSHRRYRSHQEPNRHIWNAFLSDGISNPAMVDDKGHRAEKDPPLLRCVRILRTSAVASTSA